MHSVDWLLRGLARQNVRYLQLSSRGWRSSRSIVHVPSYGTSIRTGGCAERTQTAFVKLYYFLQRASGFRVEIETAMSYRPEWRWKFRGLTGAVSMAFFLCQRLKEHRPQAPDICFR